MGIWPMYLWHCSLTQQSQRPERWHGPALARTDQGHNKQRQPLLLPIRSDDSERIISAIRFTSSSKTTAIFPCVSPVGQCAPSRQHPAQHSVLHCTQHRAAPTRPELQCGHGKTEPQGSATLQGGFHQLFKVSTQLGKVKYFPFLFYASFLDIFIIT